MRVLISYQYNGQPTIKFFGNNLHKPLLDCDFVRLWASFNSFLLYVTTIFKGGNGAMEVRILRVCILLARHLPATVSATLTTANTICRA